MTILSTKSGRSFGMCLLIQYDSAKLSTICSGWREKESVEIRKWLLGEMKLMDWPKYSRCFPKESSVLSKRIVGARQKNRRFFLKESTMLRGSSQYTLRYHLTAMPWKAVIRDKNIVKSLFFHLGFREAFSLLPFCLWIHLEQHHRNGRFRKRYLFFRWDSVPLWGLLRVFESFMA